MTTVISAPRERTRTTSLRSRVRRALAPYIFVGPFLVAFALFMVLPLISAFNNSFYADRLVGGRVFVGFDNYRRAFDDSLFWQSAWRVIRFGVVQVIVMLTLSTMFAIGINRMTSWVRHVYRLGIFLPFAIPSVVAALMWGYLYSKNIGPIPDLADAIGTPAVELLSPSWILFSIGNIVTWSFVGYNMIIIYAALQTIPPSLYEAAELDGATKFQQTRTITLPLLRPALLLTTVFSIIGTLQLFAEPETLRRLAPQSINSSFTPNLYALNIAFVSNDLSYAAAVSFIIGFIAFVLSYAFMFVSTKRNT